MRPPAARVLAALVALLTCAAPTAALDVKLWPLVRWTTAKDRVHLEALGPLVEWDRTPEASDLRIRPLLWVDRTRDETRTELLYPLGGTHWRDDYRSARLLLFTWRNGRTATGEWESRTALFPFFFQRSRPGQPTGVGLFPFYLSMDDFLGWDHVEAILFPLYLRLSEPRVERRFFLFPFVSTIGGEDGRGFRVFPFYGTKEIAGRERSRYVAWPFHIREERLVPGYGWETRRVDFPIRSTIDGPLRTHRAWGVAASTYTVDRKTGTETFGGPWPARVRERRLGEEEWRTWRVFPFYGRSDHDGLHSRFWAWPALRWKMQDADDFHYERRDVLFFLWRRQTFDSGLSGRHERFTTIFPLLRSEIANGRRFGQFPALADSLLPKNRGVLAMWAPLYGAFRWDDGTRDWSVLWGLLARRHGRLEGPWHVRREESRGD